MANRFDWTREEVNYVVGLYREGLILKDIARLHNEKYCARSCSSVTSCIVDNTDERRRRRTYES